MLLFKLDNLQVDLSIAYFLKLIFASQWVITSRTTAGTCRCVTLLNIYCNEKWLHNSSNSQRPPEAELIYTVWGVYSMQRGLYWMNHRLLWPIAKTKIKKYCCSLGYYPGLGRPNLITLSLSTVSALTSGPTDWATECTSSTYMTEGWHVWRILTGNVHARAWQHWGGATVCKVHCGMYRSLSVRNLSSNGFFASG